MSWSVKKSGQLKSNVVNEEIKSKDSPDFQDYQSQFLFLLKSATDMIFTIDLRTLHIIHANDSLIYATNTFENQWVNQHLDDVPVQTQFKDFVITTCKNIVQDNSQSNQFATDIIEGFDKLAVDIHHSSDRAIFILKQITETKAHISSTQGKSINIPKSNRQLIEAVLVLSEKNKIISCSDRLEEIIGFTKNDILNKSLSKVKFLNEKLQNSIINYSKNPSNQHSQFETLIYHENGQAIPVFMSISTIQFNGDNSKSIIIYLKDITHERQLHQHLIQSEKMASLGRLASGITHELRNPLAIISATAQFSLERLKVEGQIKEHFETIYRNVQNANRIVKEMLDFARPRKLSLAPYNLNEIIERTIELIKLEAQKKDIEIATSYSDDIPDIKLDNKYIEQVLLNMILNAIQAIGEKGTITINTAFNNLKNEATLIIQDNGPGISLEIQRKIFDPFFTTKDSGTGLGLAFCQNIINAHGGNLQILSQEGEGATFIIDIPVNECIIEEEIF